MCFGCRRYSGVVVLIKDGPVGKDGGKVMEGILFMVFWIGSAAIHTLYDLKVKPRLQALEDEQTDYPRF
jgi:hypothetical protein